MESGRQGPRAILVGLILTLALGAAGEAHAQAAGAFARMGFGARGLGLGNALAADASGDASPYYNPALAPFTAGQSLEATAALLTLDRELQFLQFATPLRPRAGIAAGLVHAGVSGIDGRDASGYHTGDYATDEFAFFLAFGTRLGRRVTAGVGLQLFRADYLEELDAVTSLGIDLGLTLQPTEALRLGLVVEDLLAHYAWDTSALYGTEGKRTTDRFPVRVRFGGAYSLMGGRARLLAEYESRVRSAEVPARTVRVLDGEPFASRTTERLRLHDARLRAGGEVRLVDALTVRAGVDRVAAEVAAAAPSAGFTLEQPIGTLVARVEYAFVLEPYAVGTMHLVTLRVFL